MTSLHVNKELRKILLKRCECDAVVDYIAVVQILTDKTEPATPKIMRLLIQLSSYSFYIHFVKGKDIVLVDYFSRHIVMMILMGYFQ